VGTAQSDTAIAELQEQRAFLCRLTPDRALGSLDEAEAFLRDRGLLTRTADSSLPSLFEACHEDPYRPNTPGFGGWPKTKWGWSFALPQRHGIFAPKVHHRRKTVYVTAEIAQLLDPVCRAELERMHVERKDWARLLDHLASAGPSTADDLKLELGLKPKELKATLHPLELCGAVVGCAVAADERGNVGGFEYLRWDQLFPRPANRPATLDDLVVAAVRAAVVATEREVPRWFSWRWRFEAGLLDRLVSEEKLRRPASGWLAVPGSA
jgi:hypothetical protein